MGKLYCIPKISDIERYVEFAEKYDAGFEYNDFFVPSILDDEISKKRLIDKYKSSGHECFGDTLHGVFLDICVDSSDIRIFEASDYRVRQSMDIARSMGLRAVVFHTNYIVNFRLQSYIDTWLNRNEEYWRKILKDYPDICVYIENMFDDAPYMLTELAGRMADEQNFGVCLDVAHALISGSPVERWYDMLDSYVRHLHINDNDGNEDLHAPVGSGVFNWNEFNNWCGKLEDRPSILIEVRNYEHLEESVEYMQKNGIYPF